MSDIFREVDEAMQQDKWLAIWKEYGSTIITAILILILSTAGLTAYRSWDSSRDAAETQKLLAAIESENPQGALTEAVKDTRKDHAAIGKMVAASLLVDEGKSAEAGEIYKDIATTKSAPKNLRNLSRILYAQQAMEQEGETDIDILKPLLADDKSPWIWHARLLAASHAAHQKNDYAEALKYLKDFKDAKTIPTSLKQRGEALAHIYGLKLAAQKTQTEAQ